MSNRILAPYIFSVGESTIIANNFNTYTDWTKVVFNPIKQNIIAHLRMQQCNTCCYCKYQLGFDIKQVDIEHIIPKSEYEKFTFESQNLALSCPACNTKKNTKKVLVNPTINYPNNGTNFIIVHAHFDEYSNHIDILKSCVFVAKTKKGSETITFCELFRLSTVEQKVKAYQSLSPNLLKQLVADLKTANPQDKKEFIDLIKNAIR